MIPVGYMAKRVCEKPDWLKVSHVTNIYSVSGCISEFFTDYVDHWKHNGCWFFDTPEIIESIASEDSIELAGISLFYYEAYEKQFDGERWISVQPEVTIPTHVVPPASKQLQGFDVVTFFAGNAPECSPLSCNSLAQTIPTNSHCLLSTFKEAETNLTTGAFKNSEPGPYRIFAVHSVLWK